MVGYYGISEHLNSENTVHKKDVQTCLTAQQLNLCVFPPEYCDAPRQVGKCRAALPRWYFDVQAQACTKFIYGGCGGNKNNYATQEECQRQCPGTGSLDPRQPLLSHHSRTALLLAAVLAVMVILLIGGMVFFFVKVARRNREPASTPAWDAKEDREYLINNAYHI
nr:PREDICTED: putative Kunitz-type serine protease inhibitor [Latimeria chalumnae]|eukprot:XP_005991691.2 PREDICTED: putative Kunitz-type serine protease inhibitor [Latimeria chalumnae]